MRRSELAAVVYHWVAGIVCVLVATVITLGILMVPLAAAVYLWRTLGMVGAAR